MAEVQQYKEEISQLKEAQQLRSIIVIFDPPQLNTEAIMENFKMQKREGNTYSSVIMDQKNQRVTYWERNDQETFVRRNVAQNRIENITNNFRRR